MKVAETLLSEITELIEPTVRSLGCEIYELKFLAHGSFRIQLMIDHPSGVTLELCEKVSREISVLLDVEDLIDAKYDLEVSSPGIYRELKNTKDFKRFQGQRVKLVIGEGEKKSGLTGFLIASDEDGLLIEDGKGKQSRFPQKDVVKVNLNPII